MSELESRPPIRAGLIVEQSWQRVPGGSGTYVAQLTDALSTRSDVEAVGLTAWHRAIDPAAVGLRIPVHRLPLPRTALYRAWEHTGLPRPEWTSPGLDLVHATTWAVPDTRRPLVVTVHDLAFLRDPSHFTPHGVRFFTRALERTRDHASAVIVPSQATARDCESAGIPAERLFVIPHGAPSRRERATTRPALDLPDRYVFWCGTWEPRKNVGALMSAFAEVAAQSPDLHLVLAGPRGWGEVAALDARSSIADRVHLLGRLDEADLFEVYARARAFCFPSLWEGFGLPVLEAMSLGIPVVTSRHTSMAEIAEGAGVLVDPLDPSAIADGIRRAVGPEHDTLAADGRARAAGFTWDLAAERTTAAYRAALGHEVGERAGDR